jgi:Ca-activated chloride channel family protein
MSAALPVAQARRSVSSTRSGRTTRPRSPSSAGASLSSRTSPPTATRWSRPSRGSSPGDTALYTALYVTLKDLARQARGEEPARRAVIGLSDGEDTASVIDDEQILDLARRAGVVVYTIGLLKPPAVSGHPKDTLPTYILTALARETGGRAHFPSTLAELDGAYDRIAQELRTLYGVGYVSRNSRADGQWRKIAIRTRQVGPGKIHMQR